MTRRRDREHAEQVALFEWAALQSGKYPELETMYAIPNGGDRNVVVASKLKAEGVKAGVPDVCLPVQRYFDTPDDDLQWAFYKSESGALYIELKAPADPIRKLRKGRPTPEQLEWIERLRANGNCALVCYGAEEAQNAILKYLNGEEP